MRSRVQNAILDTLSQSGLNPSLHPEMLLFLSKIRRLSVREDNDNAKGSTVSEIAISSEKNFEVRKNMHAESYTVFLSAQEN